MYAHFKLGQPSQNHVDLAEKLLEGNPEIRPGLLDRRLLEGILHRTVALGSATAIRETLVLRSDCLVRETCICLEFNTRALGFSIKPFLYLNKN